MFAILNKKKYIKFSFAILCLCICASKVSAHQNIPSANSILKNIKAPAFRDAVYNITAYGAVADGKTDAKAAFDKAISLCSTSGGGMVEVPAGKFFIAGPVVLK